MTSHVNFICEYLHKKSFPECIYQISVCKNVAEVKNVLQQMYATTMKLVNANNDRLIARLSDIKAP